MRLALHIVDRALPVHLGCQQPRVGLGEDPPDLTELGDALSEQDPALRLGHRLIEAVLGHTDRAEAEIELADVDRIERRLERLDTGMQHILPARTG